ncbi:putative glycosidase C21B10.07 [Psilocybe cubensis]|uniref:GH16 domain-containing protein n=2 Tax=Psilocybe cubensis TaxID=181762 RepID=A0A8H7XVM7_PSICU|nr:putative glycosidase C21B10.07 [Psilocybe cubensis]KAH9482161.1 putative glycosidase C21B10.07 [Psilocybe cubensis]
MQRLQRLSVFYALTYLLSIVSADYLPFREHAGASFFDGWAYYGNVDNTTWGNVTYLDQPGAQTKGLTFINAAGNAVIKVDNTSTLAPPLAQGDVVNRDSIRLTSIDTYGIGSLIIIDVLHLPYGCSVWPSFWTYGMQEEWPNAGEIDIIEGINNMQHNQIALHTPTGCFQAPNPPQSGTTLETDCSTDRGCIVAETKPNSFGPGFAQAGGGVYAVQMDTSGIYVWFWSRPDVPMNIQTATSTDKMSLSTWGMPSAAYPVSACNVTQYFPPQNLVLLTSLCGAWAAVPDIYQSTCKTPTGSCFFDNVLGPPSNFDEAYWEVKYVRTYFSEDLPRPSSSSSSISSTPTASATQSDASAKSSGKTLTSSAMLSYIFSETSATLTLLFSVVVTSMFWV